jgi:hypothetical protein
MDDKLRVLIAKIEQSDMTDDEKEGVYTVISDGMRALVLPILVKYMPQDQVTELTNSPEQITVDRWVALVEAGLQNEQAQKEIPNVLDKLLVEVTSLLAKEGIA